MLLLTIQGELPDLSTAKYASEVAYTGSNARDVYLEKYNVTPSQQTTGDSVIKFQEEK